MKKTVIAGVAMVMLSGCAPQLQSLPSLPPEPVAQATPTPQIPPDPLIGLTPDVRQAITQNQLDTLHHGTTILLPYSKDAQPIIKCAELHTTEIRLNLDEQIIKHGLDVGDSHGWEIKDNGIRSVFLKPTLPNIETNLTITTTKDRSYGLVAQSLPGPTDMQHSTAMYRPKNYVHAVEYYYPDDIRQQIAARNALIKAAK